MGEPDFGCTGFVILAMLLYGFIALISNRITFVWQIAVGGILFIFILELIMEIISGLWIRIKKK